MKFHVRDWTVPHPGYKTSGPARRQTAGSASQPTAAAAPGPAAQDPRSRPLGPCVWAILLYCILIAAAER